jgi:competence protein ComEC
MAIVPLQTPSRPIWDAALARLETRLEVERDRVGLWLPVAMGAGIALWFILPHPLAWAGAIALLSALVLAGRLFGGSSRIAAMVTIGAAVAGLGLALVWGHSAWSAGPVVARPVTTSFMGRIERVEPLPARATTRLIIAPSGRSDLPARVRLTLGDRDRPGTTLAAGQAIAVRARFMPPPGPALPGGYDFAQRAWFDGIGAVGSIIGRPVVQPQDNGTDRAGVRVRLTQHIQAQLPDGQGGIAAALVTGDRGGISEADNDAMQRSGLAHLLSVSGLHITAVVGGTLLLLMRLLALSPRLALRTNVPLLAAAGAAVAAMGYTWMSGSEVPTIRSCIAALLVLAALALGREAVTLRLVAAGALMVMLLWPEAVAGPSFQLSFAAVTVIVALHEHPRVQGWFARRGDGLAAGLARSIAAMVLTGVAIELVLMPIALFHFHRTGVYGALANVIAIPLTTFIIMPAEALGLALDSVGLGAPAWWVAGQGLGLLLALAHGVSDMPGAVMTMPRPSPWGFGLSVAGLLWLLLWQSRWRWWGAPPVVIGAAVMMSAPTPDLLVTSDGRHVAARMAGGDYATLRARAGEFVREQLSEAAGNDAEMVALADLPGSECNADMCRWTMQQSGRNWTIMAAHSRYLVETSELVQACAAADIVIADRWLPLMCKPRWLLLDRDDFDRHGGVAIYLDKARIETAIDPADAHPWRRADQVSGNDEADPQAAPAP